MTRRATLRQGLSFEELLVIIAALIGFAWNLQAISDNTAFVHIRTGIDMVRSHHVPHHDGYSFTAAGQPWVLQSWFVELFYGVLQAMWSSKLIVLVNAVMLGVLSAGMVLWVRTGRSVLTLMNATVVMLFGLSQWSTRPATFGIVLFFVLLATMKRSLWWTVLIAVLWVNMHGTWPIGLLWLVGVAVGTAVDDRRVTWSLFKRPAVYVLATLIAGVCNPVGWRLLWFPSVAVEKSQVFKNILEWQSPSFHDLSSFSSTAPLIALAGSMLLLFYLRPGWRHVIPYVGMFAMSLYSMRNLAMLGVGLSSILGVAYRERAVATQEESKVPSRRWGPIEAFTMIVMVFIGLFQVVRLSVGPDYGVGAYPVAGIAYAKQLGYYTEDNRVFAPDFVGCLRILQDGRDANVFIDDRYDMYPVRVSKDASTIGKLGGNVDEVLNDYKVSAVLYLKDRPLTTYLQSRSTWKAQWSDENWILFTRVNPL